MSFEVTLREEDRRGTSVQILGLKELTGGSRFKEFRKPLEERRQKSPAKPV